MGMSELGQKSKRGERGEAFFSFVQLNFDILCMYYYVWKKTSI